MENETGFDWERDCGSVGPLAAAEVARGEGLTYTEYAEAYRVAWPWPESAQPDDLVEGMVEAMETAKKEES